MEGHMKLVHFKFFELGSNFLNLANIAQTHEGEMRLNMKLVHFSKAVQNQISSM